MGVRLNGIDLESDYGFIIENVQGLGAPRIRRNTVTIPGVHGSIDFGGTFEERDIFLIGYIRHTGTHSQLLNQLNSFFSVIAPVPFGAKAAPLFGQPLSSQSVLSSLQLPDYISASNKTFQVIYNGTFDVDFLAPRQLSTITRVRIGFRQPKPWFTDASSTSYFGDTSSDAGYFYGENADSLHVAPVITFKINTATVSTFSLYNVGVDHFNTKTITGTIGGTPTYKGLFDLPSSVNGGIDFQAGTDFVTYPISSNIFSQDFGTVELLYYPSSAASTNSAVLWTLYVDGTHYWRCWYDHTTNRFKFQTVEGANDDTVDSGIGISAAGAKHKITCSWAGGISWIAVNGNARVQNATGINKITYPSTLRIGSFGDNTLPADGTIDELIIWNRDVGADYTTQSYTSRAALPFGRPVQGVLLYAGFDFSPNAVGCGDKLITYGASQDANDVIVVDMDKRTAILFDSSGGTTANAIASVSNQFWEVYPGTNFFRMSKTGAGNVATAIQFSKKYLM